MLTQILSTNQTRSLVCIGAECMNWLSVHDAVDKRNHVKFGPSKLFWKLLISMLTKIRKRYSHSGNLKRILGDPGAVSRVGRKGGTKVFKYRRKSPWVPTLTELFPKIQADAGSWLGTKNALYYCAQSANSFSWVLFVSSYTTAIVSITACLAHAPKKCTQSGNFQFDIKSPSDFKILSARKLKTLFQKYKLELTTGIHACIGHVLRKY